MAAAHGLRSALGLRLALALGLLAALLAGPAGANPIADSQSQVGPWRVGAYTRGTTTVFDHCALSRVQSEGFAIAVGYTASGIWVLALEAPDWGLTPQETYTTSIVVGPTGTYRFTGRATSARVLVVNASPEMFGDLRSGARFSAGANQHSYSISLDGIEAASTRVRECVKHYATSAAPPAASSAPAPSSTSSALVSSIQVLLSRLGYDPGPPNGTVGLKTNMAISAFQKSLGEPGDGLPSEAVRQKLEKVVAERGGAAPPAPRPEALRPEAQRPEPPKKSGAVSAGTGFHISPDTLITNFHVINGCTELHIRKNGAELGIARVVAVSQSDDLAALRSNIRSDSYLKLRAGAPIEPAEAVLVFGYPLPDRKSVV